MQIWINIVLVVQWGHTHKEVVVEALNQLAIAGGNSNRDACQFSPAREYPIQLAQLRHAERRDRGVGHAVALEDDVLHRPGRQRPSASRTAGNSAGTCRGAFFGYSQIPGARSAAKRACVAFGLSVNSSSS